jgi:hypothetical protein
MNKLAILFLVCTIIACNEKKQEQGSIPIDQLKVVVWQLMQADEFYNREVLLDSTWKLEKKNVQFYQQIFDYHKIDRVRFYKQMSYLEMHPVEFKVLMDSVEALSKREKNESLRH